MDDGDGGSLYDTHDSNCRQLFIFDFEIQSVHYIQEVGEATCIIKI